MKTVVNRRSWPLTDASGVFAFGNGAAAEALKPPAEADPSRQHQQTFISSHQAPQDTRHPLPPNPKPTSASHPISYASTTTLPHHHHHHHHPHHGRPEIRRHAASPPGSSHDQRPPTNRGTFLAPSRARILTSAQKVNEHCFEKCVPKPGSSLSSGESVCFKQCMDKYMAAWNTISNQYIGRIKQQGAAGNASSELF